MRSLSAASRPLASGLASYNPGRSLRFTLGPSQGVNSALDAPAVCDNDLIITSSLAGLIPRRLVRYGRCDADDGGRRAFSLFCNALS